MATEHDYYQNLAKRRAEDRTRSLSERDLSKKSAGGNPISSGKMNTGKKDLLSPDNAKNKILGAALAFTAIDLEKDAMHFVVILVSLIADLLTLIPFIGSFLALPFSLLIWILYAISGHLEKRIGRKAVITATSQACELIGGTVFAILAILPFYTISAFLNFWLAVAERKTEKIEEGKGGIF